jgi:hypothetical protein
LGSGIVHVIKKICLLDYLSTDRTDRRIGQEEALTPTELTSRTEPSSGGAAPSYTATSRPVPVAGEAPERRLDVAKLHPKVPAVARPHRRPLPSRGEKNGLFSSSRCRRKKPRLKRSTVGWEWSFAVAFNGRRRLCTLLLSGGEGDAAQPSNLRCIAQIKTNLPLRFIKMPGVHSQIDDPY